MTPKIYRTGRIGNENKFKVSDVPPECQKAIREDGYGYTFWEGNTEPDSELSKFARGFIRVELIPNILKEETTYKIARAATDLVEVRNWYVKHEMLDLWKIILEHSQQEVRSITVTVPMKVN